MKQGLLKLALAGALVSATAGITGCGHADNAAAPQAVQVQGKLVQGPIDGAVIFADKIDPTTGTNNFTLDAGEVSTTTAADGSGTFTLSIPPGYGQYVLVSQGGKDHITNKPAMQMVAPPAASPASQVISPLTTLVALTPAGADRDTLVSKIAATGTSYDADISTVSTPAALVLVKSVETSVAALGTVLDPTNSKLNDSQLADIQVKTMAALATQFKTATSLSDVTQITSSVNTAVNTALPVITASHTNITVVAPSAIASISSAISNTVSTVATTIQNAIATTGATGPIAEATIFTTATQSAIDTAVTTQTDTVKDTVTVTPPPLTVLLTNSSVLTGIAIDAPVKVRFSRSIDPATVTAATVSVEGVPSSTPVYNSVTRTVTIKPLTNLSYGTTYSVLLSGIKDLNGIALAATTLTFTTVAQPVTGSTGSGSGGTGANF